MDQASGQGLHRPCGRHTTDMPEREHTVPTGWDRGPRASAQGSLPHPSLTSAPLTLVPGTPALGALQPQEPGPCAAFTSGIVAAPALAGWSGWSDAPAPAPGPGPGEHSGSGSRAALWHVPLGTKSQKAFLLPFFSFYFGLFSLRQLWAVFTFLLLGEKP